MIVFLFILASCGFKSGDSDSKQIIYSDSTIVQQQVQFPFPEIPTAFTEPEVRKSYLLTHYWDKFNFADTTLVNNRDVTEQGFVNFIALLADGTTQEDLIRKSLENWCRMFVSSEYASQKLMDMADSYLYNPNSPFYNEYLYEIYLESLTKDSQATDFTYYLSDGTRRTLADTPVKNNFLLLIFYDPECDTCHDTLLRMAADAALMNAVRTGKVTVLAVYTEGNEEAWLKALSDMPEGWIVGTDREAVKTEALYDLKAMPTLYLLDNKKRVVLKDAPYDMIRKRIFMSIG